MEIMVSGHHMDITKGLRSHVDKRLQKVENHFNQPTTTDVVLHKEKSTCFAEATIHGRNISIHAKAQAHDFFAAIDSMSHKLDRQVLKHKERLTDHSRHNDKNKTIRHLS